MEKYFIGPPFGNYLTKIPGIIPIKGSYTLKPREGLWGQVFNTLRYKYKYGGFVNKIGLRNNGIDYGIKNYKDGEILSVAVLDPSEIPKLIKKIPKNIDLELNVSCPNVDKNYKTLDLQGFLNKERRWCILKLDPLCKERTVDDYYNQGFRQFHCSNTLPVPEGGLSGSSLIIYNKILIPQLRTRYPDIEIIGGGGIKRWSNIQQYRDFGANHFAFSTVAFCPYLLGTLWWNIYS